MKRTPIQNGSHKQEGMQLIADKKKFVANNHPDTVFVNHYAVIDLVLQSKLPAAENFRDWLYQDVIMSILLKHKQQLDQNKLQLEQHKQENKQLKQQLTTLPRLDAIQLNCLKNANRELEYIYIMTSKCLNAQNLFKVGKSSDPKQRLSSLNTSIIADEHQMFLCYKHECYDSLHFEKVLHTILDRYRYVGNREFFQFNLDGLIATIEDLCNFNLE
jgi:hypothetical protein